MIDTLKIVTQINEQIYKIISSKSNIKCMYNKSTGEIFYEIINDSLECTYDSRLSVRVSSGSKYGFFNFVDGKSENTCYALEIERKLSQNY